LPGMSVITRVDTRSGRLATDKGDRR